MPNWWEQEPNANPQAAEWRRLVSKWRQQLGESARAQTPRTYPQAQPVQPEPVQPEPVQPQPPAQDLQGQSVYDIWRWWRERQQEEPTFPVAKPPTGRPAKPKYPYQIYLPTIPREEETGRRGALGYYPRRPPEVAEAGEEPLPPGAPGALWERDLQPTYEERGKELAQRLFPQMMGGDVEKLPEWMQKIERFVRIATERGLGRVIRAWEHPEKRALMGGPVTGLGTAAELEAEEAEEAELEPGKLKLGQFFERAWEHFRESQEAAPGAHLWEKEAQEAYQRLVEAETPEEREEAKQVIHEAADTKAPYYPWAGKIWEDLTRLGSLPRDIERWASAGLTLLQEGAYGMEEMGTAIEILRRPESHDLEVEQWYPLTTRGASLFYRQMKETIKLDSGMAQQFFAGQVPFQEWSEAHAQAMEGGDVLSRALLDIADGTATAEEIALANENLGAELVFQILVDPCNLDLILAPTKAMKARHLAQAQARMLGKIADNPKAVKALEQLRRAMEAGGLRDLRTIEKAARKAGEMPSKTILEQLGDVAKVPFELTPEAKSLRDLGEMTIAVAPVVALADNGDDALRLLRLWAEDAAALRPLIGRIADSVPGRKASIVLGGIIDQLDMLPSATGKVWDVKKFWTDLDQLAHEALRAAHGYTKPNRIQKFFGTYKRLMSEFYLTATYSPGYVTRNAFGDCAAMAIDGLLTFESREVIDAYLDSLGTFTTRRIMTEGKAGREALTGEGAIKSVLPGPMGKWSEIGQRITRFAEPGGRLPLGEEARYRRALYKGLKRFFDQNALHMTPDLPDLVMVRYGDRGGDLRHLLGIEPSLDVRRQVLEDFISGQKGKQLSPLRYIDEADLDAMSPEITRKLLDEIGELTSESSPDDLKAAIGKIRDAVDEDEARRLAEMENLPARSHIQTDIDEAETADGLIDELEDVVARTGDRELAEEVEAVKARIPEIERELDTTRAGAIDGLKTEPTPDGLEVLMRANSDVEQMRNEWRKLCDTLRRDAKAAYDQSPGNARAIWGDYFRAAREGWEELAQSRIARYREAADQLGRLRQGESLEDILGATRRGRAEEWLFKSWQMPEVERPVGYLPGKVLRDTEGKKFERFLDWNRSNVDSARTNSWRAVYGTEPEDYGRALDLLDSADRDVEQFGKATSGRIRELYREAEADAKRMWRIHRKDPDFARLAVDRVWEKYWAIRNDTWRQYWDAAQQRWQIAERDILMENYTRGQRMEALRGPKVEELPAVERPVALSAEDGEIVKRAVLKPDAEWTAEERAAIERWTKSGRATPDPGPSLYQGATPGYTRDEFFRDLKETARLTDEESQAMNTILDALATTWARRTGYSPEAWYTRHFAGLFRGNPPPGVLWQGAPEAPRWWFKAEQVVDLKMPQRAPVEQVRNILTKGGIKQDELRWNGVLRWLDEQEGMVTKDDVMSYLQSNRIELEEVVGGENREVTELVNAHQAARDAAIKKQTALAKVLRENDYHSDLIWQARHQQRPRALEIMDEVAPEEWRQAKAAWERQNQLYAELEGAEVKAATKYEQYTEPGAVQGSYREFKMILPYKLEEPLTYDEWLKAMDLPEDMGAAEIKALYERELLDQESIAWGAKNVVHEPHFSDPNILAHVRFAEHGSTDGERVLFIDEMQSWWHQTGRQAGYRPTEWPETWTIRKPTKQDRYVWRIDEGNRFERLFLNSKSQVPQTVVIRYPRPGTARSQYELYYLDRLVETFDDLETARRMGYEAMADIPDNMLAAFDESGFPIAYGTKGAERLKDTALRTRVPEAPFAKTWDELCIKRMIRHAAENDYDAIAWTSGAMQADRYPKDTRKVIDQLEWVKYEDGTVVVNGDRVGHRVFQAEFGPTGTGLFLGQETTIEAAFGKRLARQIADAPTYVPGITRGQDIVVGDRALADLYDKIIPYSANKLVKRWGAKTEELALTSGKVPGFHITPQMKRDVLGEGLPLFKKIPDGAFGATDFLEDGRAVIRFFESSNLSTAVHEVGHVVLPTLPAEDLALIERWAGLEDGDFLRLHESFIERSQLARKSEKTGAELVLSPQTIEETERYVAAQEKFARAFERYLSEGVAPTPELQTVFERLKQWLLDIYNKLRDATPTVDMNNEIRGVFDRLLAENPRPRSPVDGPVPGIFEKSSPAGSPAFRRWFGGSKAVDGAGGPRIFYHGTSARFSEFEPGIGGLIWFSDRQAYPEWMVHDPDRIMEVYLRAENPLELPFEFKKGGGKYDWIPTKEEFDAQMRKFLEPWGIEYGVDIPEAQSATVLPSLWVQGNGRELAALGKEMGFDAIVVPEHFFSYAPGRRGKVDFADSWVVFDPKQIKSTGNRGSWDTEAANILLQPKPGDLVRAADLPGIGAESLADEALKGLRENGGYTLALDGGSPEGGYAVAVYPNAERIVPEGEITNEDILQYIDDWADVLSRDPRAHLGGWVDEGQAYLDLSAVIDDLDEAILVGWQNKQKAIFNLSTFEDVPVTEEAAQQAALRLGRPLEKAPTSLMQTGTSPRQYGFWNIDPQNWKQYQRAINQPGASAGPLPHDILQRSTDATRRSLDKVEGGMVRDWNSWQGMAADEETANVLRHWFDNEMVPSWFEQRAVAYDYATSQANHALLDYGKRRNFDTWINYVVPYHYWFTRAGANWAKRLASRPGLLSTYSRVRDAMELANENAGRRQRFQHMIRVPFPWLPGWMGDSVYVDPSAMIAPFSQIFYTDWNDNDDSKRGLRKIYDTARGFGLRPYHIWEYLYQTGKFAKAGELVGMDPQQAQEMLGPEYRDNFPNVLPQTNLIRSLTALAREAGVEAMPPGGINIEAPFRRLLGLPAGEIWDPYRINRMLANIAAENPHNMELAQATLRAQELVDRDKETQTGKTWSASSEIAQQTATELGWTPEELQEAQEILATAMQRATHERGIGTVGWLTGPRLSIEPEGERAQLEMAAEARTKTWSPERPGGSREAYEQFKRTHPAMYPRATQYEVMPGEKEYEAMPPGARANWLNLKYQKELLHDAFDEAVDNALRVAPWNWEARGALEDQRRQALAALEVKYPMPEMEGDIPAVLYGMNPEEMWNSTVEKALYAMQASKPSPAAFETSEGVDWDAYYTQVRKWEAALPRSFDFGIPRGGNYNGMDPKMAMDQFEKRYDSPLEAAYEAYQTEIAEPAWAEYNRLKGEEERLFPGMKALQGQYWDLDKAGRRTLLQEHPELKDYWDWKDRQGGSAYARTVGQVEAVPAAALIPVITKLYPVKGWTEEQLRQELQGVVFPALAVQQDLKREQRGETAWQGTATAAAGGAGGRAGYPQYSAAELNYLKNQILRRWNARQGRYGGGGGRRYSGGRYREKRYGAGEDERWEPQPIRRGGPFTGVPGSIWGGPFRG